MAALADAMKEGIWFDQAKVEEAEYNYQMFLAGKPVAAAAPQANVNKNKGGSKPKVEKVEQSKANKKEAQQQDSSADLSAEVQKLRLENEKLQKVVSDMTSRFAALESRLSALEGGAAPAPKAAAPAETTATPAAKKPAPAAEEEESDEDDLFGSDSEEEDEEAARIKEERLKAYAEKKAKKPGPIAKSNIMLDVKPWSDETDMKELERLVRSIEKDGLKWGASKLQEIAYGITKLVITCVVEDDKVGTDFLEEQICGFEDHVQSMDIAAFNKI